MTRMHRLVLTLVLLGGSAAADDKSTIDACEKGKKTILDQEARGRCKAEAAEVKKITCSPATAQQVTDLVSKCDASGPPKCRALDVADAKLVIAEAEDKLSTQCLKLLIEKLQQKWCTTENKGKKFEYVTEYDHVLGAGKFAKPVKGSKQTHTCRVASK